MHGAFKTPGGKLVQVDFDLEDEILRNVEVTGDFFLYPEEALTKIGGVPLYGGFLYAAVASASGEEPSHSTPGSMAAAMAAVRSAMLKSAGDPSTAAVIFVSASSG